MKLQPAEKKPYFRRMQWNKANTVVLIGIALLGLFLWHFSNIVSYILIAWVLSVLLRPLYMFFRHRLQIGKYHAPKSVCILLTFALLALGFVVLGRIFVPVLMKQIGQVASVDYNAIALKLYEPLHVLDRRVHEVGILRPEQSLKGVLLNQLKDFFQPAALGQFMQSLIGTAGNFIAGTFAVTFILYFFLSDSRMFTRWLVTLTPVGHEHHVKPILRESGFMLGRYFRGLLLQMAFVTLFLRVGLWLIGVKNALVIALLGALLNVIPYVGPLLGGLFAVLLTITSHLDLPFYPDLVWLCTKVILLFSTMQILDNVLVAPYIFSKSVKAHPLEIFFVVLVSGQLAGIIGMLIAIPAYTILRIIAAALLGEYKLVQQLTGQKGHRPIQVQDQTEHDDN